VDDFQVLAGQSAAKAFRQAPLLPIHQKDCAHTVVGETFHGERERIQYVFEGGVFRNELKNLALLDEQLRGFPEYCQLSR
jgi:hypothetical protein